MQQTSTTLPTLWCMTISAPYFRPSSPIKAVSAAHDRFAVKNATRKPAGSRTLERPVRLCAPVVYRRYPPCFSQPSRHDVAERYGGCDLLCCEKGSGQRHLKREKRGNH